MKLPLITWKGIKYPTQFTSWTSFPQSSDLLQSGLITRALFMSTQIWGCYVTACWRWRHLLRCMSSPLSLPLTLIVFQSCSWEVKVMKSWRPTNVFLLPWHLVNAVPAPELIGSCLTSGLGRWYLTALSSPVLCVRCVMPPQLEVLYLILVLSPKPSSFV